MTEFTINNLDDLNIFAGHLAKSIMKGDVISLKGDLAAGKTSLVQAVGRHLGVEDYITSPTFALVNIYQSSKEDLNLYHLDLYRLERPEEIENIDFETYFYPDDGISFIEWAEMAYDYLPEDLVELEISFEGEKRNIFFTRDNERSKEIERCINESFSG